MSTEIQTTRESFDVKLDEIKEELPLDQATKSDKLNDQLKERSENIDLEIAGLHAKVDGHVKITEGFQGTLHSHNHRIFDLE